MGWKSPLDEHEAIHIATIMTYIQDDAQYDKAERKFILQTKYDAINGLIESENRDDIEKLCAQYDKMVDTSPRICRISTEIRNAHFN